MNRLEVYFSQQACVKTSHPAPRQACRRAARAPATPLPPAGIKACVDAGKLRDADRLLQRMGGAGVPPDARAYNALLAGYARGGNTAAMARLLQRMGAGGVAPSAVTFNTVRARRKALRWLAARAVLRSSLALGATQHSRRVSRSPTRPPDSRGTPLAAHRWARAGG